MKKTLTIMLAGALALATTNCTTTYDAYGNPRQSVDPGTAVAGAAAAGVLGYAIANNNKKSNKHYHHHDYRRDHRSHGYYDRYGRYHRY